MKIEELKDKFVQKSDLLNTPAQQFFNRDFTNNYMLLHLNPKKNIALLLFNMSIEEAGAGTTDQLLQFFA